MGRRTKRAVPTSQNKPFSFIIWNNYTYLQLQQNYKLQLKIFRRNEKTQLLRPLGFSRRAFVVLVEKFDTCINFLFLETYYFDNLAPIRLEDQLKIIF